VTKSAADLGCAAPAHIVTAAATVRRIVNMTAITVVEASRRCALPDEVHQSGETRSSPGP